MIYDFHYRDLCTREGAPDHGTIADAQIWAQHYDARIGLFDRTGHLAHNVDRDGRLHAGKRVLFDTITPHFESSMMAARAALQRAARRADVYGKSIVAASESAQRLRAAWLKAWPAAAQYFSPMAGKDAVARYVALELEEADAVKRTAHLGPNIQSERAAARADGETLHRRLSRLWRPAHANPIEHTRPLIVRHDLVDHDLVDQGVELQHIFDLKIGQVPRFVPRAKPWQIERPIALSRRGLTRVAPETAAALTGSIGGA